jgi:O-antigen/teichoic acid export membrane protein
VSDQPARSLAGRAARSALWLLFGRAGQVAIAVVTLVIMARFLGPEIYGAFALAMLAMTLGETFASGTFADTLIQRRDNTQAHLNAAFLLSVVPVALLALLVLVAARPVAGLLDAPDIATALPWMGLVAVLIGLGAVPSALLQRDLRQRPLVLIDQSASTLASATGIALAVAGAGIWALVTMELVRAGTRTLALLLVARYRPGLATSRSAVSDIWRFGRNLLASRLVQYADRLVPRLAIGLALGAAAVGIFQLGWRSYELIQKVLVTPLTSLSMATAARTDGDLGLLRQLLTGAMRVSALVAYPGFIGAAAIAPTAIPFAFGPQWAPAVLPTQILLLIGMRASISGFNGGVMRGLGRPDMALWLVLMGLVLNLILVPIAAPYGVAAVAGAVLLRSLLTWPVGALFVQRLIALPASVQLRAGLEAALASALMAAVVWLLQVQFAHLPPVPLLALLIASGSAVYVLAIALLAPRATRAVLSALRSLARGDRKAARAALAAASAALR